MKINNTILNTCFVSIVTLIIFYILFSNIDLDSVVNILAQSDISYLFLAIVLSMAIVLINVKRWQTILKIMDFSISYKEAFNVVMSTFPFASITPSITSDAFRAYYLKDRIRASKIMGSVLTERVLDFSILCMLLFVGIIWGEKIQFIGVALVLFSGIVLVAVISYINPNLPIKQIWNERLHNILNSLSLLGKNKRQFSIIVSYSIIAWALSIIQIIIFFYALGIKIPFLSVVSNIPLAIIIGQIPITLGGAGTRDAAIIILFSGYARPEQLLGVGILFSFFRAWLLSLVGLPFLKRAIKT